MRAESIDCSHDEWVYAEDRCALCGVTAFDLMGASYASFVAHTREAAEQKRMWEERAPLRAAIAREATTLPAFPARALRTGLWTISDLVE
jgi:hypothetical protein